MQHVPESFRVIPDMQEPRPGDRNGALDLWRAGAHRAFVEDARQLLSPRRSKVKRDAAIAFAAALARPHNVAAAPSLRKPRILPSLRHALPTRRLVPAFSVEFYEVGSEDVLPCDAWRIGWYWTHWENPHKGEGEPAYEGDGLPALARGPFKSKGRAEQAVARYLSAR